MPSSFVHALLPPACLLTSASCLPKLSRAAWVKLLFVAAFLANSPDLDIIPASLLPSLWLKIHRNWGHNIFAFVGLVALGQWLLRRCVSGNIPKRTAWLLAFMLVGSHLLLDSMMGHSEKWSRRPGVPFFWPFLDTDFSLPWALFGCTDIDDSLHPLVGLALSKHYWARAVYGEIFSSLLLLALWLVVPITAQVCKICQVRKLRRRGTLALKPSEER